MEDEQKRMAKRQMIDWIDASRGFVAGSDCQSRQQDRKIIHIDMDAFYAAIEQRDRPELRGKPVIVGGHPEKRGVVATCSYEARKFGIHSAMPSRTAFKLRPHAIFLPARFEVYRAMSAQIMQILRIYTDLVEPVSLDEAYLDVTENKKGISSATRVAREIKQHILAQTQLTASAHVPRRATRVGLGMLCSHGFMWVSCADRLQARMVERACSRSLASPRRRFRR